MEIFKHIAQVVGYLWAMPHLVGYWVSVWLMDRQRALVGASERIGRIPGYVGIYARRAFYRRVLARVGRDVYVGYMSFFSKSQATLGDRVYVGRFCSIGWANIGNDVMLADGVQISSGGQQHGLETQDGKTLHDNEPNSERIIIEDGAWLGAGAIVMADVGSGAIVAAGAVVTRPIPARSRVAGVPARPLESKAQARAYT